MVPSAGNARPQLKRGLMSSARIWLTRSSMMMSPDGSERLAGAAWELTWHADLERSYRVALRYACPEALSRGRKSHGWATDGQRRGDAGPFELRRFSRAAIMARLAGEARMSAVSGLLSAATAEAIPRTYNFARDIF